MEQEETKAQIESNNFPNTRIVAPIPLRRTKLWVKRLKVKIFVEHNKSCKRSELKSQGRVFNQDLILHNLWRIAMELEQQVPGHIYKCIEVGNGEFNFVWQGTRQLTQEEVDRCRAITAARALKEAGAQGTT